MKIQIASLAALERLIGGDTELEIQIRESVVQDFAKKHLKSLVAPIMERYEDAINREISFEIKNNILGTKYNQSKDILNEPFREVVKKAVKEAFDSELRQITIAETEKTAKSISDKISEVLTEQNIEYYVKEHTRALLRKNLNM